MEQLRTFIGVMFMGSMSVTIPWIVWEYGMVLDEVLWWQVSCHSVTGPFSSPPEIPNSSSGCRLLRGTSQPVCF